MDSVGGQKYGQQCQSPWPFPFHSSIFWEEVQELETLGVQTKKLLLPQSHPTPEPIISHTPHFKRWYHIILPLTPTHWLFCYCTFIPFCTTQILNYNCSCLIPHLFIFHESFTPIPTALFSPCLFIRRVPQLMMALFSITFSNYIFLLTHFNPPLVIEGLHDMSFAVYLGVIECIDLSLVFIQLSLAFPTQSFSNHLQISNGPTHPFQVILLPNPLLRYAILIIY